MDTDGQAWPRRVMLLTSSLTVGGAEAVIASLARHFDRSRFEVTVGHLKERGTIGDQLADEGHDVVEIPRIATTPGKYFSFRSLHRVVRERRIELLHTHTTYSLTDAALCRLASLGDVKLVHTFHFGNYPHLPPRYLWMERVLSRAADHLVSVGVEQMGTLKRLYGIADSRITPVLNGVNPSEPRVDGEWAARIAADGRTVIGTTATFIEQKGLMTLLDVAALLKTRGVPALFVIVGDGVLRPRLEAQIAALGVEGTVLLAGWKADAAATMTPLYDILLQPSLWEAMSVVVLEAMAAARPVVATDVGDNRHVVIDGETGWLVAPRDVATMADRLSALVADPEQRRRLGAAGQRRYQHHYTAEAMARAYEVLFTRVLTAPIA